MAALCSACWRFVGTPSIRICRVAQPSTRLNTYEEAVARSVAACEKKITKQSFSILDRIAEIDRLLQVTAVTSQEGSRDSPRSLLLFSQLYAANEASEANRTRCGGARVSLGNCVWARVSGSPIATSEKARHRR